MPSAERRNDVIEVQADFHENQLVSLIPGARHQKTHIWHIPLTWAACITLRSVFGPSLDIGPELTKWSWDEYTSRIKPALDLREAVELPPDSLLATKLDDIESGGSGLHLNTYQRADVAFLVTARRALLANPPGLGKTAAGIRTVQVLQSLGEDPLPVLVICPNSLKITVWLEEIRKWAPEYSATVIDGSATKRRKQIAERSDFTIINWESLRLHSRLARYGNIALTDDDRKIKELNSAGFRTVIMDEAHRLSHPRDSKQARAAWALAHDAEFRYALTGTPVADHVGDLWGLLHGILPESFSAKTKYLDRFAEITYNYFGGMEITSLKSENEKEFRQITDPVWRRIPKEVALPMLPPKLPVQYRLTPMNPSQSKLYKQMQEEALAEMEDGQVVSAFGHLPRMTRLLQFASASAVINEDGKVRLSKPSCKVDNLVEILDEMGDNPIVVAAVSRQLIELASSRLHELKIPHGLITGAQSGDERANAVRDFQAGKTRAVLLTLGAGSEGITLTAADTIVFMQRSFRVLENEQTESRVYRIGSEEHQCIRIIHQVTPNTIEEKIKNTLESKENKIEEILRDREAIIKLLKE